MRRVWNAGSREKKPTIDTETLRKLSEIAQLTRKPGQAHHERLAELRKEYGL